MKPSNPIADVKVLAASESTCEIAKNVFQTLRDFGLDADDLREIIVTELGEAHCYKTAPTEKYYPDTMSDYFSLWVDDCQQMMFLKLLIINGRLVITSFKKDDRHE